MKNIILLLVVFILPIAGQVQAPIVLHEEDRELYDKLFEQAGKEFDVPSDILRGISFAETRWTHLKWGDDDKFSPCNGMPRVYGVMGLWDNEYFGHSLNDAAELIGKTQKELKESPLQNIRGAAALLKKYYSELPKPSGIEEGSLESWQNAIAKFSGFPQEEIANKRGLETYSILSTGYNRDRISIKKNEVNLEEIQRIVNDIDAKFEAGKKSQKPNGAMNTPDYPLAKWNAAHSDNYGTTLIQQKFVVIHDVEGSYLGCISWFKQVHLPPSGPTSAHYVLNSHPNGVSGTSPNNTPDAPVGEVTQMVEEKYRAYHVGCWNSYMVGIEHEGYAGVSGWYTPECYDASSKLVKYLCDKYNIPKDRNHVIAHGEHQNVTWRNWVTSTGQGFDPTCNTHTDPGPYWTWANFMTLVTSADTIRPVVTNALSQSNLDAFPAYKEIVVEFNTNMDVTSTNDAFSITPNVAGTKNWSADNKILTFKPGALLPWSTVFTVKIDTSAKNVAKSRNLGTVPYVKIFTTVPVDTVGPRILVSYPYNNAMDVPLKPEIWLQLTDAVQTSSLSTTLKFTDANNASVSTPGAKNETIEDRGVISFLPILKPNQTYTIKLLPGVKDYYNNASKDTTVIQFKTEGHQVTASGLIVDQFEMNGRGWLQPNQGAESVGIDTVFTRFTFSSEKKLSGSNAGKLSYKFTAGSGGIVQLRATSMPVIDSYSLWGIWVYGDMNFHRLKAKFSPNDQYVDFGKIHWRGWKFLSTPISSLSGSNKIFVGLTVTQDSSIGNEGVIYFDDIQLDAAVTGIKSSATLGPAEFLLDQNYPNPFNPATNFSFSLPKNGFVSLKIYDLLGKEVSTVITEVMPAGKFDVSFDASHLPSGVYFYSLRSGEFQQTRKMVLLK